MNAVTIVGVDPGLQGGIAVLTPYGPGRLLPMPTAGREIDLGEVARILIDLQAQEPHVALERAQAFPKAGVSGMFRYGCGYGGILGVCAALAIPVTLVAPAKWHRMLCTGNGNPKARAAEAAGRLFPDVTLTVGKGRKPHEGVVDALLIAEAGRRLLNGAANG